MVPTEKLTTFPTQHFIALSFKLDVYNATYLQVITFFLACVVDLGSVSDWSRRVKAFVQPIRSTTQIWAVTRHQYGISTPVSY